MRAQWTRSERTGASVRRNATLTLPAAGPNFRGAARSRGPIAGKERMARRSLFTGESQ